MKKTHLSSQPWLRQTTGGLLDKVPVESHQHQVEASHRMFELTGVPGSTHRRRSVLGRFDLIVGILRMRDRMDTVPVESHWHQVDPCTLR